MRKRYSPARLGNELWRGVEQLSRAGYDMPMQVREVLEDLRLGRIALRTEDPGLPDAADRLGRRLFSGLVVRGARRRRRRCSCTTIEHETLGTCAARRRRARLARATSGRDLRRGLR